MKLNRDTNARKALLRTLAFQLFTHEKIDTTFAKAKALRPFAEKLITKSKVNTVAIRRQLLRDLPNELIVSKLLSHIGPKMGDRPGGYLRVRKLGNRVGDDALLVRIEFVDTLTPDKKTLKKEVGETQEKKTSVLDAAKNLVGQGDSKIKVTRRSKAAPAKEEEAK